MNTFFNDIKVAFRQLRKNPGFTAMAVLTLALCIGANTAVFGVLHRVVLKPLPFPDSERLIRVQIHRQGSDQIEAELSAAAFQALGTTGETFESVTAYVGEIRNLSGVGTPRRTWGTRVSPEFFRTFGVAPSIGQAFPPEAYGAGGDHVVLLSDGLWRERFGGRSDVLGEGILLDGKSVTIAGVMPSEFRFPQTYTSYWTPLVLTAEEQSETEEPFLSVVGRLKPEVSVHQMRQRLQQFTQGYAEQQATAQTSDPVFVGTSLLKERLGGAGRVLWILFGAVSCVTLIGSVNLVNLYLTRLGKRRRELVVRMALGAEGRHILRQWSTESCVLSLIAGVVGVTLATWFIHLLRTFAPYGLPRADEIGVDPQILGYGFTISLLVGVGMSIIPLAGFLRQSHNASAFLRSREGDATPTRRQTRSWLVATQAAIATLLLIGAGLLWNSFRGVTGIDPGFSADRVLSARIVLSEGSYEEDAARRNFYRRLTDRVAALPDVAAAGMVNALPLSDIGFKRPFSIENVDPANGPAEGAPVRGNYTSVSVNYFQLMGISILAGRSFQAFDEEGAPVVLVNASLADRFFPGGDAVGRRIKIGPGRWRPWMTIVGITADVKIAGRDAPSEPTFYVPYQQKGLATYTLRGMFLVVKTRVRPESVVNRLRRELNALDPTLALANIETMDGRLYEAVATRRYHSTLMGLFAALALTLAMIGIFGVLSCVVADRRREIGVRMALGSNRRGLFQLILNQGLKPVLAGVFCGWALAWASRSVLAGYLFGIAPHDPMTFISVGLLFMTTATLACLLPAYRAATMSPMEALRYE